MNSTGDAYFAGNVGIGIVPQSSPLYVRKDVSNWGRIARFYDPSMVINDNVVIHLGKDEGGPTAEIGFSYQGDTSDQNVLFLGHYDNPYIVNIRKDGNVGIGTTNPQVKLEVNGSAKISGDLYVKGKKVEGCKHYTVTSTSPQVTFDATECKDGFCTFWMKGARICGFEECDELAFGMITGTCQYGECWAAFYGEDGSGWHEDHANRGDDSSQRLVDDSSDVCEIWDVENSDYRLKLKMISSKGIVCSLTICTKE